MAYRLMSRGGPQERLQGVQDQPRRAFISLVYPRPPPQDLPQCLFDESALLLALQCRYRKLDFEDLFQVRHPLESSFVEGSRHGGLVERDDVDHVGQVSREPHRPEHVL